MDSSQRYGATYRYSLIETQVELEDSIWQLMTEPQELSFFNVDRNSKIDYPVIQKEDVQFALMFDVSQQIQIEKRQVTSLPSLFGDVGGINEFLSTMIILVIGGC